MDVTVGDQLEIKIKDKEAVIKPKKQVALEVLEAIQKAFKDSGITPRQFQKSD